MIEAALATAEAEVASLPERLAAAEEERSTQAAEAARLGALLARAEEARARVAEALRAELPVEHGFNCSRPPRTRP